MVRKIKLTSKADKKFASVLLYLTGEFGAASAKKFLNRTQSFLNILADFPTIGTLEDKEKAIFAFVLEKQVTVFYRFDENQVIILDFFDTRTHPKKRKQ